MCECYCFEEKKREAQQREQERLHERIKGERMIKRTPIRSQSKKGEARKLVMRNARIDYLDKFGFMEDDHRFGACQSCSRVIPSFAADMAHKIPAGRGGNKRGVVDPRNLIYCCIVCHDCHTDDADMIKQLISSDANSVDGGIVLWSEESKEKIKIAHQKNGWVLRTGRPR